MLSQWWQYKQTSLIITMVALIFHLKIKIRRITNLLFLSCFYFFYRLNKYRHMIWIFEHLEQRRNSTFHSKKFWLYIYKKKQRKDNPVFGRVPVHLVPRIDTRRHLPPTPSIILQPHRCFKKINIKLTLALLKGGYIYTRLHGGVFNHVGRSLFRHQQTVGSQL